MRRILVVEDELEIQELLRAYLQEEGYQVETAGDGVEALSCFAGGSSTWCFWTYCFPKSTASAYVK